MWSLYVRALWCECVLGSVLCDVYPGVLFAMLAWWWRWWYVYDPGSDAMRVPHLCQGLGA